MSYRQTKQKKEINIELTEAVCDGGCGKAIPTWWAVETAGVIGSENEMASIDGWYQVQRLHSVTQFGGLGPALDIFRHYCPTCAAQRFI